METTLVFGDGLDIIGDRTFADAVLSLNEDGDRFPGGDLAGASGDDSLNQRLASGE
jgi:hypothetical protein